MSNTSTSEISTSAVCANCGKEGSDVTNRCNKCKSVMYCNAACKKKHRHKHKKECERRVAELHDEKLFKQPPPLDDCPICFLRSPHLDSGSVYMSCCGTVVCRGCLHTVQSRAAAAGREKDEVCPFCRTPIAFSDDESLKRLEKRMDMNDSEAIFNLGCFYARGLYGLPQSYAKALKLWHRAAEFGCASAYSCIGISHDNGRGVEEDHAKSLLYYELAAMGGDPNARFFLGVYEERAGNVDRALKHYMIAVKDGNNETLKTIQRLYLNGHATKDDYAKALRSYQGYLDEIKSDQRDQAAASNDEYKYYESTV